MRILTLHNKYKIRGGGDESSEREEPILCNYGHFIFRYERDSAVTSSRNLVQIAGGAIYNRRSYRRIRELIRCLRLQIVDVHNFFPLISPSAYYACQAEGIPVVQTLHDFRLVCPNALFFRDGKPCEDSCGKPFPYAGIQHRCYRENALGSAAVASMIGFHRLMNTWRDRVSTYITITEFCRKKFIEAGLPPDKIRVKANFVDPDPRPGDGLGGFALFVGRLSPENGLWTMLQAWELLRCPIHLAIVGEGPMADYVAEQCSKSAYIQFLGRLPVEQVYELMGKAKFSVFPSESDEAFGRVAIEAFAKGTPVIISEIGAIAELVQHGRTGWYFPPGNAEALAAVVDHLLANQQLLPAMRREARREFEMKYTAEANYRRSREIFDEVISRSPRGPAFQA